jgi:uncharacterized protein YndB with AHSA1/START domain
MADMIHEIRVAASPEAVYAAIATQDGLRGWWTADTTAEPRAGTIARLGFGHRASIFEMRVEALDPGRRVEWSCLGDNEEWKGTRLTWTVDPDEGGTRLRFVHGGWRSTEGWFGVCNSTWGELMYRLKAYAETGAPRPHWTE